MAATSAICPRGKVLLSGSMTPCVSKTKLCRNQWISEAVTVIFMSKDIVVPKFMAYFK